MSKFVIAFLFAFCVAPCSANAFLRRDCHPVTEEWMKEDSILGEISLAVGAGSRHHVARAKAIQASLESMYAALPKNDRGLIDHATVRYALHRWAVNSHGWYIRGLEPSGGHWNSSSPAGVLKGRVPAYMQGLLEKLLGERGLSLRNLAVLASTFEQLVHSEAVDKLEAAYAKAGVPIKANISHVEAHSILKLYMAAFITGEDLSQSNNTSVEQLFRQIEAEYPNWVRTQEFVRTALHHHTIEASDLAFADILRLVAEIAQQHGTFQNKECSEMKDKLLDLGDRKAGRVRLTDFYRDAVAGNSWQFSERKEYLRELGALDETSSNVPRIIVPNYVVSPANCIVASNLYSVCCMNECEGLLAQLENEVAAPTVELGRVKSLIETMTSSSIPAPRKLSDELVNRLEDISRVSKRGIRLHGRLFAQWMHHAFPAECPYPHIAGTTAPRSPDEWMQEKGEDTMATHQQMLQNLDHNWDAEVADTAGTQLWSLEEELPMLQLPVKPESSWTSVGRVCMLGAGIVSAMTGLFRAGRAAVVDVAGDVKYSV